MGGSVFTKDKIDVVSKALQTCTMCGFCKSVCPSFKAINVDTGLSRGRIVMTYGLAVGDLVPTRDLIDGLYTCTTCADCVRRCPSKVPIVEIVEMARADVAANGGLSPKHRKMCENIVKYNNPFAEPKSVAETLGLDVHPADVAYFAGCTATYRAVRTAAASVSILRKLGVDFTTLDEVCCGSVMQRVGWPEEDVERQMRTNVERIAALGVKTLVLSCAGCYRMFKVEYPKHMEVPFEVLHMSEFLEREGVRMSSLGDRKVTYHDPCHIGRHCGVYEAPRNVIKAFDGVDFREMRYNRQFSHCCGGGGGVRAGYPELSAKISSTRVAEAEDVGADLLVTTCPFCVTNLKDQAGDGMQVVDLVELVDEHLAPKSQRSDPRPPPRDHGDRERDPRLVLGRGEVPGSVGRPRARSQAHRGGRRHRGRRRREHPPRGGARPGGRRDLPRGARDKGDSQGDGRAHLGRHDEGLGGEGRGGGRGGRRQRRRGPLGPGHGGDGRGPRRADRGHE